MHSVKLYTIISKLIYVDISGYYNIVSLENYLFLKIKLSENSEQFAKCMTYQFSPFSMPNM